VTVVIAVGNDGSDQPAYPAADAGAIAVASTSTAGVHSAFSDFGAYVALCAPAESSVSLLPDGGYGRASGVSFAAPLVSGAAALVVSSRPGTDAAGVRGFITSTAVNLDGLNPDYAGMMGSGMLAAGAAVTAALPGADLNDDGVVNVSDFLVFLQLYAAADPLADVDGSGAVTVQDFLSYLRLYALGR
jgi:subtilisin family serine protease